MARKCLDAYDYIRLYSIHGILNKFFALHCLCFVSFGTLVHVVDVAVFLVTPHTNSLDTIRPTNQALNDDNDRTTNAYITEI